MEYGDHDSDGSGGVKEKMGEVLQFAPRGPTPSASVNDNKVEQAANNVRVVNFDEQQARERRALLAMLKSQGITVLDDQSFKDFDVVMRMLRGMKDRQEGRQTSDDCLYLECLVQAMYDTSIPEDDGKFDELLSKL